jgi:hypothetical protein
MGVWTGLCIFDYAAFTQTVIPALQAGETHPIVQHTIELINIDNVLDSYPTPQFQGLQQVVSACDPNMISCSLGREFHIYNGEIVETKNIVEGDDYWNYWKFVKLFEDLVARHTITHYYVFGRYPDNFDELFCNYVSNERNLDPTLWTLLDLLDRSDKHNYSYWAHGSGGYGEGIRGWLDPEETELLLATLEDFSVRYRDTYLINSPTSEQFSEEYYSQREEYEMRWGEINIFRNIIQMAVELKQGLLWGRDLGLFYNFVRFDENEVEPIDLENKFGR